MIKNSIKPHIDCFNYQNSSKCSVRYIFKATKQGAFESVFVHFLLTYAMNVQAETNQDKDKGLVYNYDEARVLATVITTFNEQMECTVEEQGQQYIVTYSLKAGINKLSKQPKA